MMGCVCKSIKMIKENEVAEHHSLIDEIDGDRSENNPFFSSNFTTTLSAIDHKSPVNSQTQTNRI